MFVVALGSVCKLVVVGFSSPCQFQLHRDRWEKCYYLNVIAQYCYDVLSLSHQSIIVRKYEVQYSDKYCNKYNYNPQCHSEKLLETAFSLELHPILYTWHWPKAKA